MTVQDIYLLGPELALASLAAVVVILDLIVQEKRILVTVSLLGLLVPFGLTMVLWGYVDQVGSEGVVQTQGPFGQLMVAGGQITGVFNTLVVDKFAIFLKFLVLSIVALIILGSYDYMDKLKRFQGEFYALVLFSAVGMMLLVATTELISIYVSLELTALPLIALSAFLRDERSSESGIKFFLLGAISSALLLYGVVLVYGFTGSTHLHEISHVVTDGDIHFGSFAVLAGITLIVAGFGFKISVVPFHMWVPDVYEGSPTPVTAYLSVASKAAGFAVLLRVFYVAFGSISFDWGVLFSILSALSMTIGNLLAIAQNNIKRLMGYSTIAHAGYIMVGLAAVAQEVPGQEAITLGPSGILFYLVGYAATNLAAFFAIMAITNKMQSDDIDAFAGMAHNAPVITAVLAFSMVSLIGIPPTVGFMGKLYLFNAAVSSDMVWLAIVGVINSVVSAYYYLRVIRVMYMDHTQEGLLITSSVPVRLGLMATTAGILGLGLFPGPIMEVSEMAVKGIFQFN